MWKDPKGDLDTFVKVSNTLEIESLIIAEWNMNDFAELYDYGSYRFRPSASASQFFRLPLNYDNLDTGSFYRDSEKSFFTFSNFVTDTDEPVLFQSEEVDRSLYFDLKECFNSPRPRSGINKVLYFQDKYIDDVRSARRPRYYMSSRYDNFKYWSSYRTQVENEEVVELGVSTIANPTGFTNDIGYFIDDTAPFVVYKDAVPTNRIVVKMQTNLADSTSEISIRNASDETIIDPLQDRSRSSIPQRWRIEYLDELNNWVTAATFNENSVRRDGTEIIKWDGYVELYYGLRIPEEYKESFNFIDYIDNESSLPFTNNRNGDAYIIGSTESSPGTLYIWNSQSLNWTQEAVQYQFSLLEDDDTKRLGIVTDLTDPLYFRDTDNNIVYRQISMIKGLRVSVETMIAPETAFDLIELSPRLTADISRYVSDYSFSKSMANNQSGVPVGELLASNGSLSILNDDGAFTEANIFRYESDSGISVTPRTGSLIARYLKPNIKFTFYEAVLNVNGYDKFVPMKTMYAEEFSPSSGGSSVVSIPIRDLFYRIEEYNAPSMFLTNTTLTSAVAMLLDNIGFSNYIFKGFDKIIQSDGQTIYPDEYPPTPSDLVTIGGNPYFDQATGKLIPLEEAWDQYWEENGGKEKQQEYLSRFKDPVIPYFFVSPDSSTAQVLADLALSCQAAMFFDEYNNLVVMPKEYILPEKNERITDVTLYGQTVLNESNQVISLPNIQEINNYQTKIINDGVIQYNIRYIQRSVSSFSQLTTPQLDEDRTYGYLPVLLWEVGNNQETKTVNEQNKESSAYSLGAAVLNTSLSASVPYVENNEIKNNIIDLGENVYWLPRFQSYLFANGEIIRYDAIEYEVSGTGKRWITSNLEYQRYFASLPFNGKIYPTGNVRIFVEPYYVEYENAPNVEGLQTNVTYKNGEVKRHGRGQFGTEIVDHPAGLPEYWSSDDNVRGLQMDSSYIFSTRPTNKITYPSNLTNTTTPVGQNNTLAKKSDRTGIIKNLFNKNYPTDDVVRTLRVTQSGTIQASALSFFGPLEMDSGITKRDFVSYVYKNLNSAFKHFGTRMRIIGRLTSNDKIQSPTNSTTYFNVQPNSSADSVNIDGGSGGIAVGINPETNHGYYFEICSLTKDNLEEYFTINEDTGQQESVLHNLIFYKIMRSGDKAIPVKLWGGLAKVIVDEGYFVGMDRVNADENLTVYDLAVEYENVGNVRRFYLYVNNAQIATVEDSNPLPEYSNLALFVRGSSQCMFENVYALQNIVAKNTGTTVVDQISDAFAIDKINSSDSIMKYNVSGFIRSSYLTNISTQHEPKFKIYFEEFGTILRECQYFNIRYDQAYPALIAQIAETFGQDRGYSVSGFYAGSYGAEFLIFNNTDRFLILDETTGRYLRIIGVTFTQDVTEELTVDDFFNQRSKLSDPFVVDNTIRSPIVADKIFEDIKSSRKKYGKKDFNLNPIYIQTQDDANDLMEWLINKTLVPKSSLMVSTFGMPQIQLGDILTIDYDMPEGVKFVETDKQFVVYSIDHARDPNGMSISLGLMEI